MLRRLLTRLIRSWNKKIIWNDLNRVDPISPIFGLDRGTPIDRYFIEKHLSAGSELVKGVGVEVGGTKYLRRFDNGLDELWALEFEQKEKKGVIVADLVDTDSIPDSIADCLISTQVYNFIYDVRAAIKSSYRLLKPGGVLIGTVAGLSQVSRYDADRWGDYWRFTPQSIERLLREVFSGHVEISPYGNSLAAACFIQGVAIEDLPNKSLLDHFDQDYPIVIGFVAIKE